MGEEISSRRNPAKKKRKRERKIRTVLRCSDDQNSLNQEVKSIYATKATLQGVGILPTLVYFHHKGCF